MPSNNAKDVFIEKFYDSALRKEDTPFTQIYNFVVQNLLNHEALVIWLYLQTKPSTWKVNRNELLAHFIDMGRDKIEKCIAVLKNVGLIEVYSIREGGKIVAWETYVKCGIGCEEKILNYKKQLIQEKEQKKNKKNNFNQNPEIEGSGVYQNTEIEGSGEKVKIPHKQRADEGKHQIPEIPGSGESVDIERKSDTKEREKERNTLGVSAPFFEFWNTYQHDFTTNRKSCHTIWVNKKLDAIAPDIIKAVERFKADDFRWLGGKACSAKTFLLESRWEEDPILDNKLKKEQEEKAQAEQNRIKTEKRQAEQSKFSEEEYQRQKQAQYQQEAKAYRNVLSESAKRNLGDVFALLGAKSKFVENIE